MTRVALSLVIAAVGLVLALAVHPASPGAIDINTVGWILFAIGSLGSIIDLLPYLRRGS
ncbi:MAG TPA: hypothetical protein VLJ44_13405 [Gaiellaceae bacterium]|nr:hypothetical protein [Gaiellaceae bacterium]